MAEGRQKRTEQEHQAPAEPQLRRSTVWIALAIGNSRLHWALFSNDSLQETCDTPHVAADVLRAPPQNWLDWQRLCPFFQQAPFPDLWVASVVPQQAALWQHYPRGTLLQLADVPLKDQYPTLGIDRAIALWGAGTLYGWPALVIDAGTALTVTGADSNASLVGGAILPGLGLQAQVLGQGTAALPKIDLPQRLPELWARDTSAALQSGIGYGVMAAIAHRIQQWDAAYPHAAIVLTGGDAVRLKTYLQQEYGADRLPPWLSSLYLEPHLVVKGIALLFPS